MKIIKVPSFILRRSSDQHFYININLGSEAYWTYFKLIKVKIILL